MSMFVSIKDIIETVSTRGHQLNRSEYGSSGSIPIIDQSEDLFCGYTNDATKRLSMPNGVVIFGDHTRVVKYYQGDFVAGADGTKILRPADPNFNSKLLYYLIDYSAQNLTNLGYARHFKELKEQKIWLPNLDEQQKIVEILSDCDIAIEHVEQQASLLVQVANKTIKGLAENVGEPTKLSELCSPQQWQTIGKSELLEEGIPVFGANGYIGYYSEANHNEDTVAVTCRGATCGEVSWVKGPAYITGNAMCLDDVDESQIFKRYLYYQLGLGGIKKIISGSAQPQIIGEDISRFKVFVPTLDYQSMALNVFEAQVSEINLLRKQLTLLKQQKRGLMQQLLTGKLRVKGAA